MPSCSSRIDLQRAPPVRHILRAPRSFCNSSLTPSCRAWRESPGKRPQIRSLPDCRQIVTTRARNTMLSKYCVRGQILRERNWGQYTLPWLLTSDRDRRYRSFVPYSDAFAIFTDAWLAKRSQYKIRPFGERRFIVSTICAQLAGFGQWLKCRHLFRLYRRQHGVAQSLRSLIVRQ